MRLAVPGAFSVFEKNQPLVTSSRALAAVAYQQFARSQLNGGSATWQRPEIYTFDAWLTSLWQEARYSQADVATLLSPSQEHFLWQQVVASQSPGFFDTSSIARLARGAADVVAQYTIPLDHEAWSEQQDAAHFHSWYSSFRTLCRKEGWMARREILERLQPGAQPVFVGFEIAPAPGRLLPLQRPDKKVKLPLQECEGIEDEIEVAARWTRAHFEANPSRSIAVFVPDLRSNRPRIERIFQSVFYPGRALKLEAPPAESVFHVNSPQPLTDHPVISTALLLLELVRPRMAQSDAASILRNPFLTGALEERALRARADLNLRRSRELEVSLRDLEYVSRDCPRLQHVWKHIRTVLDRRKNTFEFPRWSRFFADLLHAAGWPGEMELSPEEQSIVEMWKDALSSLSALGMVSSAVTFETALGQLKRLLAIGGAETGDWLSPVQILDAADAPGMAFDASFLIGLGDETWPAVEPVSPLIPLRLQRACGVPVADPVKARHEGLNATRALINAAPVVAGSYSVRVAPQVRAYARVGRFDEPIWTGKRPFESFTQSELEEFRETNGPAFDISMEARGGTSIIKEQSRCPFRAFAARRLGARLPDDASFGFDALDRGIFLHSALQNVWAELKTQRALKAASPDELSSLVHQAVEKAVEQSEHSEFYSQATRVERERLEQLVYNWLNTAERDRTVPFTVESAEQAIQIELAGLPLNVRMDRIDRLENGGLVLIDYKSGGDIVANRLKGKRPAEPQLLVYAAAQQENVEGLLFGFVAPRDSRWNGISHSKIVNQRTVEVCKDWDAFMAQSCEIVEGLAAEFARGDAIIAPSTKNCLYCDIAPLCRKQEQTEGAEDSE